MTPLTLANAQDIITAALAGAGHAHEQSSMFSSEGAPLTLGQTLIAIDVGPPSGGLFGERLEALISEIEAEPGARLPGTRRLQNRKRAAREGLPIDMRVSGKMRVVIAYCAVHLAEQRHIGKLLSLTP